MDPGRFREPLGETIYSTPQAFTRDALRDTRSGIGKLLRWACGLQVDSGTRHSNCDVHQAWVAQSVGAAPPRWYPPFCKDAFNLGEPSVCTALCMHPHLCGHWVNGNGTQVNEEELSVLWAANLPKLRLATVHTGANL